MASLEVGADTRSAGLRKPVLICDRLLGGRSCTVVVATAAAADTPWIGRLRHKYPQKTVATALANENVEVREVEVGLILATGVFALSFASLRAVIDCRARFRCYVAIRTC